MSALLPDRAISTWDQRHPACMIQIPSRFGVRVTLYSSGENRYVPFECERPEQFELGEHTIDGGYVALRLKAAGTTLAVEFAKGGWSGVSGRVRIIEPGEMLYRCSVIIEAGFFPLTTEDPGRATAPLVDGRTRGLSLDARAAGDHRCKASASGRWREQHFHLLVGETPAFAGQYSDQAGLAAELTEHGWCHHHTEQPGGDLVAFRFYGDPREPVYFALAQDADPDRAASAAQARLVAVDELLASSRERALADEPASRAIRDVVAWNSVWDAANDRPYTCCSRGSLRGLGGWGVWLADAFFAALLCARAGDPMLARANLYAACSGQQAAGNLPALAAADETWVDRTQLQVGCFMVWRSFLFSGDRGLLAELYPVLRRQLEWALAARDGNGNGLYEYGSSPIGDAQGVGTKQGACSESGMDNLAIFDDAVFNRESSTLELEDPGHNSLLALELETLGRIAHELGEHEQARALRECGRALAKRISEQLWDPERAIFAARHWDGRFASQLSPTSFFPLLAGAATEAQIDAMVGRYLCNEDEFWGALPLPNAPFSDPASADDSHWRGRIWAPMIYIVWEGLRRVGRTQLAGELAQRAWTMFEGEWSTNRHCYESYSSADVTRHAAQDCDPFYTWGALIPFIFAAEQSDVSPWSGLQFDPCSAEPISVQCAGRDYRARQTGGRVEIDCDGRRRLAVWPPVAISAVVIGERVIGCNAASACNLQLTGPPDAAWAQVAIDGRPAEPQRCQAGELAIADVSGKLIVNFARAALAE